MSDLVVEAMGSLAFTIIAGVLGVTLAVPVASLFVPDIGPSNFLPYAAAGFVLLAPFGFVSYRLRDRYLGQTPLDRR